MINSDELSKRLNNFRDGEPIEPVQKEELKISEQNRIINKKNKFIFFNKIFFDLFQDSIEIIIILSISFFYGLGTSALFNQDWSNLEMIGAGFIFYNLWDLILNLKNNIFPNEKSN